jgi:putative SOS response-associated peptidase YedK
MTQLGAWIPTTAQPAARVRTISRRCAEFTEPYPAEEMMARPVSTLVNNPRNDSSDLIARAGEIE